MTEGDQDEDAERLRSAERYRRQLIAELERRPLWQGPGPGHLVNLLFGFLLKSCGEEAARYLFVKQGRSKEPSEKTDIDNDSLLALYDLQKEMAKAAGKRFVIARFISDQVAANQSLPRAEQSGAGGTDTANLRQHLRTLLKKRALKKALVSRAQVETKLAGLQRVRKSALTHADNLAVIQEIDREIEKLRQTLVALNDRIAAPQSGKDTSPSDMQDFPD